MLFITFALVFREEARKYKGNLALRIPNQMQHLPIAEKEERFKFDSFMDHFLPSYAYSYIYSVEVSIIIYSEQIWESKLYFALFWYFR